MPIPTYTPGYPPDGSSLGQTKAVIRNNLDGTFQTLGVDHVNNNGSPGSNPAGYHTVIHQVTQTSNPVAITGVSQVYSKLVGSDTALFVESGLGVVQQLTTPNSGANFGGNASYSPGFTGGWTSLPGGLIMQYGLATINLNTTTTVPFPISFTNAASVFSIVVTGIQSNNNTNSLQVKTGSVTATNFIIENNSSTFQSTMYWVAIGK